MKKRTVTLIICIKKVHMNVAQNSLLTCKYKHIVSDFFLDSLKKISLILNMLKDSRFNISPAVAVTLR